jgi:hypothetical protein
VSDKPEPVSVTVDSVFDVLGRVLAEAVKSGGDKSKAFAWDVNAAFVRELGQYRTGAKGPAQ